MSKKNCVGYLVEILSTVHFLDKNVLHFNEWYLHYIILVLWTCRKKEKIALDIWYYTVLKQRSSTLLRFGKTQERQRDGKTRSMGCLFVTFGEVRWGSPSCLIGYCCLWRCTLTLHFITITIGIVSIYNSKTRIKSGLWTSCLIDKIINVGSSHSLTYGVFYFSFFSFLPKKICLFPNWG